MFGDNGGGLMGLVSGAARGHLPLLAGSGTVADQKCLASTQKNHSIFVAVNVGHLL